MYKIIRSALTLVGSWLGVPRLKVVVGVTLDIENVSPLGLLRGRSIVPSYYPNDQSEFGTHSGILLANPVQSAEGHAR
jgi:hypothetical protein